MNIRALSSLAFVSLSFIAACSRPVDEQPTGEGEGEGEVEIVTCIDDDQCGDGRFCLAGVCSSASCTSKSQCPTDQVCTAGLCAAPPATCASSEDCPGTLLCDGFADTCFDPNGGGEGEGEGSIVVGEGEGEGAGPTGPRANLSGFRLENRETATPSVTVLPDGTSVPAGGVLVIGRFASQADFEGFWGPLPSTAVYLDAGAETTGVPIVNGSEVFALVNGGGADVDGPTFAGQASKSYQRTSSSDASVAGNWTTGTTADATPGVTTLPAGSGLVISEWSDATGGGAYVYEFIEIAYLP